MQENKLNGITPKVIKQEKYAAGLDQALEVTGIGWYNIKYSLVLALCLISGIIELIAYGLVLPAAVCDLQMSTSQRGLIASIPYFGIIATSYPWGYLVDTRGRKKAIIYSSAAAGVMSALSGLMPNITGFAVCKLLTSLCLACPTSAPYTYIGEILPPKNRDTILSVINATQCCGSALAPLLAWAIIPLDFRLSFGVYVFRPWRLLTIVYACFFILAAILLSFGPESPKYLVSEGRYDDALKVLQKIYAGNKGKNAEDYPINQLIVPPSDRGKGNFVTKLKAQTVPLLKWMYLKWLLLNSVLLFGNLSVINGLYIWVPDVLNQVMTGSGEGRTACSVIYDRLNQTSPESAECHDHIDEITFIINSIAQVSCAMIALAVGSSVKFIGKKNLIVICFSIIGIFCIFINFIVNQIVFAILLSSLPLMVLVIGPISAYTGEIFPTHLRGMAMSMSMMLGRLGSIAGTNMAALLMHSACELMFYLFGGLLIFCGLLALLLPKSRGHLQTKL